MLEINVTVTIPGLPEAINNLAAAIGGKSAPVSIEAAQPVANATQPTAPLANPTPAAVPTATSVAPVAQPNPAPAAIVPPVPVAPATASQMTSPSEAKTYTVEQISIAGAALCEQGKMPQLIALLGKYGVQSITQLPADPAVISNFVVELKALGANL